METPTKSTPAGCLIGTLALVPAAISVAGGWGLIQWYHLPPDDRHVDRLFWSFAGALGGGALAAILLLAFAIRVLRATDFRDYDPNDPDRTGLKW